MGKVYQKRDLYRTCFQNERLVYFDVAVKQTDLRIGAHKKMDKEATQAVLACRSILEAYIKKNPEFETAMHPLKAQKGAHPLIVRMCRAGFLTNTGPMAAVAGLIAEEIGRKLQKKSEEVIVENGGDLYIHVKEAVKVGIFAGDSKFERKWALHLAKEDMPIGVCTSSGTVGHSISLGISDAVTVLSKDTALADAAATAVANRVCRVEDIEPALNAAISLPGVIGAVVFIQDKMGAIGKVTFAEWD